MRTLRTQLWSRAPPDLRDAGADKTVRAAGEPVAGREP